MRTELNKIIKQMTSSTIVSGPFAGVKLGHYNIWGDDDISSKLLGTYEHTIHHYINHITQSGVKYAAIINIGCADGYYIMGMHKHFPDARFYGIDINNTAKSALKANAVLNNMKDDMLSFDTNTDNLQDIVSLYVNNMQHVLIICDCEGAEINILDPTSCPSLTSKFVTILVECHDQFNNMITPMLTSRFAPSHDIFRAQEPCTSPFPSSIPQLLATFTVSDMTMLLNENRGVPMHWLFIKAKDDAQPSANQNKTKRLL